MTRGKKKGPAKRVPRSAGFAICSPRGLREPHDVAPRGSVHLSNGPICFRWGRSQGQVGRPRMTNARHPHVSSTQRDCERGSLVSRPLMHVQGVVRLWRATKKKPHTATQCEACSSISRDGGI